MAYALPLGVVAQRCAGALVHRKLDRLFAYRHRITHHDLAAHRTYREAKPLHVLVTGASGLGGSALVPFSGPRVDTASAVWCVPPHILAMGRSWVSRDRQHRHASPRRRRCRGASGRREYRHRTLDRREKKQKIRASRVQGTRLLCEALDSLSTRPESW